MDLIDALKPVIVAILTEDGEVNGTGFFVTSDGYILTCYHVVEDILGSNTIKIRISNGEEFHATLDDDRSGKEDDVDYAILKVRGKNDWPCLRLSTEFSPGDRWCTLGYIFPTDYSVIPDNGIVYSKAPKAKGYDIKLNAYNAIRYGASGSPILDERNGSVIGILKSEAGRFEIFAISIAEIFKRWPELAELNSFSPTLLDIKADLKEYLKKIDIILLNKSTSSIIPWQIYPAPNDFTGRNEELRDILFNFDQGITITGLRGMGGIGKTVLAYKLAELLRDRYPDGQILVDLKGTDARHLTSVEAMANIIHAYNPEARLPENESEMSKLYQSILHNKQALILLDNAFNYRQIHPLLPPSTCGVIITSRHKFALEGLLRIDLDVLEPIKAVEFLLKIYKPELLLKINFKKLDKKPWYKIAQLCGYLPLALRAAGSMLANVPDLNPMEYAKLLCAERTRLDIIGSEGVDLSIEASFNLSYSRLSTEAAHVFRFLSIFPADFDAKAEEIICKDVGHLHLIELWRWSLVEFMENENRYRLHDLVRLFAADRLKKCETDLNDLRYRFAEYYKNILSNANALFKQGDKDVLVGLNLFDQEWANIQAGQAWAEDTMIQIEKINSTSVCVDYKLALSLTNAFPNAGFLILYLRLRPRQRIHWLKSALTAARQLIDGTGESLHLGNLGLAYADLGEFHKAIEYYEQDLALLHQIGNKEAEGIILGNLGLAYAELGGIQTAIKYYRQALKIDRKIGYLRGEGQDLENLGLAYINLCKPLKAIDFLEKALAIARQIGDRWSEGNALEGLGSAYLTLGEWQLAIKYYKSRYSIALEIGDNRGQGNALWGLAVSSEHKGSLKEAIDYAKAALKIFVDIESPSVKKVQEALTKWNAK